MNRRSVLCAFVLLPLAAQADLSSLKSAAAGLKDPLLGLLTSQLGVNEDQAKGGIGSILSLAKEKLSAGDYAKVANAVPGASKYLQSAKTLGAVSGPLKNLAGLQGALGKLGMSSDVSAKFIPTVTDFVGKAGGGEAQTLLQSVLK